jgi:hypothetical protein
MSPSAAYGGAAFCAQLPALSHHARSGFPPVRDEFGTKPHRIRRAGLLHIDTLGTGPIEAAEE